MIFPWLHFDTLILSLYSKKCCHCWECEDEERRDDKALVMREIKAQLSVGQETFRLGGCTWCLKVLFPSTSTPLLTNSCSTSCAWVQVQVKLHSLLLQLPSVVTTKTNRSQEMGSGNSDLKISARFTSQRKLAMKISSQDDVCLKLLENTHTLFYLPRHLAKLMW